MPLTVPRLAAALQPLFGAEADRLARDVGLVRRRRRLTGATLACALAFGWLEAPDASRDDLADALGVSAQAVQQRLTATCAEFLRRLLGRAVAQVVAVRGAGLGLLSRFSAVYVEDCTHLALPPELAATFPGCGGDGPRAGLKLYVRWDLAGGGLVELSAHPGRASDRTCRRPDPLPVGALRLADLGFYDGDALRRDAAAGAWWLTRLPARLSVCPPGRHWQSLAHFLGRQRGDTLDLELLAGLQNPVAGRLLAWRCPLAVRRRRLARLRRRAAKVGRPVGVTQRRLCGWTVLFTNAPPGLLAGHEAWTLYRARWQVELLFKLWKSGGGLGQWRSRQGERVLCEAYAKLLGQVVAHGAALLAGGPLVGASLVRRVGRVRRRAGRLRAALGSRRRLRRELAELRQVLRRLRPTRRRRRPSAAQLLTNPPPFP